MSSRPRAIGSCWAAATGRRAGPTWHARSSSEHAAPWRSTLRRQTSRWRTCGSPGSTSSTKTPARSRPPAKRLRSRASQVPISSACGRSHSSRSPCFDAGETAKARAILDDCFSEARRRGFSMIAHNIAYNDTWTRLHTMSAGVAERLDVLASEPGPAVMTNMIETSRSWTLRAQGELALALAAIERQTALRSVSDKVRWRAQVERAEVLLELGRLDGGRSSPSCYIRAGGAPGPRLRRRSPNTAATGNRPRR